MRIRTCLLGALIALGTARGVRGEDPPPDAARNVLRVALLSPPDSLDPAQADEEAEMLCVGHLFDTLYMPAPFLRPYALVPRLAAALPAVSADGLTWRIELRRDARFTDDPCFRATEGKGRAVTASDVIFSWQRVLDERTNSPGAWHLEGRIAAKGLRALDEYTLEIALTAPFPDLAWVLCQAALSVLPKEAVAAYGAEFGEHPVGSGPFRLASMTPGLLTFDRNPTYREELVPAEAPEALRGRRVPLVDHVEVRVYSDTPPLVTDFAAGGLDRTSIPDDALGGFVDRTRGGLRPGLAARGLALEKVPRLELVFDCFNFDDPVVGRAAGEKGRALRRAMSLATDVRWWMANLYDGRMEELGGPILPEMPEFDPAFVNPWKRRAGETMDQARERARTVLADAGMPGGKGVPSLQYDIGDSSLDQQFYVAFKADMAHIGLDVRPYAATWQEQIRRQREAKFQITGLAWGADYPTAQNFLQLFYGPNRAPGSNTSNFADPGFDALYEQARGLPAGPKRTALYRLMQGKIVDEAAWIFRYRRVQWSVRQPWLAGLVPADLLVAPWAYARVDAERRAKGLLPPPR